MDESSVRSHAPSLSALHFEERSFHDTLYEWMDKAPWLALSVAAHLLVFFVLMAIPWDAFREPRVNAFNSKVELPPEVWEDPREEMEPEPLEDATIDEPVLVDASVVEDATPDALDALDSELPSSPFEVATDFTTFNDVIGTGGGAGPKFRGRGVGRRGRPGGRGTIASVEAGLAWLATHQEDDGSWDADGFGARCPVDDACGDPGHATHDVGLTGLALLAFLGDGHTQQSEGPYRDAVARGLAWLIDQQDRDDGLIGPRQSQDFLYDHALATLALAEAYGFTRSPGLKRPTTIAAGFIARARNPYLAWRYQVPPNGDNDTSVTGWMVFALAAAADAGIAVDPSAFEGALAWLDQVSDPVTGRAGYQAAGELSSRTRANEHYPREASEALTAVALLCRFFLHQDPDAVAIMRKQADLLLRKLPEWSPDGLTCDMYYWYYGSYAMFQMGGSRYWEPWNKAMKAAVVDSQVKAGHAEGSWDPIGPWGGVGGRVYATALMTLSLQVYYRYPRLLGGR